MAESTVIAAIRVKIEKLMERNAVLREEAGRISSERDRLKSANREQQEKIAELERRIAVLELRDSMGSGGDDRKARARVNRLMREVDKCIALLNR